MAIDTSSEKIMNYPDDLRSEYDTFITKILETICFILF